MFDIWGFLLQTLTVTGIGALLLIIKALFRDKLPPKWHFAVWSVLGIALLFPAGLLRSYSLLNWQQLIEFIKISVGDYSFSRVLFPLPYISEIPETLTEWLFAIYIIGIIAFVIKYFVSYMRLRALLRKGNSPAEKTLLQIDEICEKYNLKACKVIEVAGLPSAFVCGVIKPILVLPAEKEIDDKIIIHELLHLKHRDTLWTVVICFFRCLHWCNPFISYCANQAINDLEARCDQNVLELLEGEERRDYGRILLSMSNEKFAKTPGSTCINNGGKNISKRIEAIARFKKYPVGMRLVSVCIIVFLAISTVIGVKSAEIPEPYRQTTSAVASARTAYCTTYVGAFDTYAKAVLEESGIYRLMCAPESIQAEFTNEIIKNQNSDWNCGLTLSPNKQTDYYIYNLKILENNIYEGVIVITLNQPYDEVNEENFVYLAYQPVRVYKENGRWVAIALSEFKYAETIDECLNYGCRELPAFTYTGTVGQFRIEEKYQTIHTVDNKVQNSGNDYFAAMFGPAYTYTTTPKPDAKFHYVYNHSDGKITHLGTQEERDLISHIRICTDRIYSGEEIPEDITDGSWSNRNTKAGWGPDISLGGGGGGAPYSSYYDNRIPVLYVAKIYVNNEIYGETELHLQEEAE